MPLTITPLPVPVPSSTDPGSFSKRGDATFGAFPNLITETNALASEQAANRDIVIQNRIDTETAQANAANFALAASTSEANSLASSSAQLWVSGTTYSIGTVVYSPITASTYRRKIAGAGTTDPSADSTNWYPVILDASTNYPVIQPTLNLDFANRKSLDPRITFARNSVGTYFDSKGVLQTAQANVPRFDHDPVTGESLGLLIEESRTNLLLNSEQFDNAYWLKLNSTISPNTVVGLDGNSTADKLVENSSTSQHTIYKTISTTNTSYTFSVYLKASERSWVFLQCDSPASGRFFDLVNASVGTNTGAANVGTVSKLSNGWVRCSITLTVNAGTPGFYVMTALSDGVSSYMGDGTSGIYIWGAQLEAGSFATSYIPTTSTAVTRQADQASITGTNFSSWYRQDEGSVLTEATAKVTGLGVSFSDGTSNNLIANRYGSTAGTLSVFSAGTAQALLGGTTLTGKVASAYKQNDFATTNNSSSVALDTSGNVPTTSQMRVGTNPTGGENINGTIKTIRYYPKRLTNRELQAITS